MKKKQKGLSLVNTSYVEDILYQSKLLEWAGISFNNLEWYKLKNSVDVSLFDYIYNIQIIETNSRNKSNEYPILG